MISLFVQEFKNAVNNSNKSELLKDIGYVKVTEHQLKRLNKVSANPVLALALFP